MESSGQDRKISFSHLTINEGLTQNTVFAIIQDKQGFIWIGTEDGLNKFDGYDFTYYKPTTDSNETLNRSKVYALLEDARENIWVGTADGLKLLDKANERFIPLNRFQGSEDISRAYVTSLLEDENENIWIGSFEGLCLFDVKKGRFTYYYPDNSSEDALPKKIRSLYKDKKGIIWLGIGNDLERFDPHLRKFLQLPVTLKNNKKLRSSTIQVIKQDSKGNYWFGTEEGGLFFYDVGNNSCKNYVQSETSNSLASNRVRDIFISSEDELWIGTRDGLSILNLNTDRFTNIQYDRHNQHGLSHNSVRTIIKDEAGSIWLGTYAGGLNIFHPSSNNFKHIREQIGNQVGVSHRVISSIVQDEEGALWIGTEGGGLNYIDRSSGTNTYFTTKNTDNELPSDNVKSLAKDSVGNLWIGTYDGLGFYNKKEGTFHSIYTREGENNLSNNQIYSLAVDPRGIWIGTNGGGLYFRDIHGQQQVLRNDPADNHSISNDNIITLLNESRDYLWAGTEQGLNLYDKRQKTFTRFVHDSHNRRSISNNSILALFKDSRDWIWIGTDGGGINVFNREERKFYSITEKEGLSNNVVHAIQEDNEGNLWVSTNKGLSEIVLEKERLPLDSGNISINNYTVADGLQSNQFLNGAVEKGAGGELLFGGINGVTTFFPEQIIRNTLKPKVVITDFLIHNKTVGFDEEESPLSKPIIETDSITLTYDQAFITFKFAALNYINPYKNQYAYKLEGFSRNNQWNFIGDQRSATYTNLKAGNYIFKVTAANNDGVWNDIPTQIHITVLPPYWKTWWAYCIYAIVIASLLFLFYHFSLKNARLKNRLLYEHMAHEKEQELNQGKLRFFTNISHEIKTPLTLILAPLEKLVKMNEGNNKIHNQLMLMQRNGERLFSLINQLLDFRKFESGSMKLKAAEGDIVKFAREIFIAFEPYAHHRKVRLQFSADQEEITVWFDRDKMEKILYNLLSNAIKFTPRDGEIFLKIKMGGSSGKSVGPQYILLEVEDNGIGISSEHIDKIFDRYNHHDDPNSNISGTGIGLAFTKGLVELHKGEISVESRKPDVGVFGKTIFRFKVPLGREHLSDDQIVAGFTNSEDIQGYAPQPLPLAAPSAEKKTKIIDDASKERPIMLVVEDNVEVLQFVAENFAKDFEVHSAADGVEGMELAFELIPDIVISDVMMPRLNGMAFCNKIKTDTRTSHIPVILLTARTPLIFKIEGLETGADDYITKPFNLHFLEARVWNLLESRQKLRERYRKEVLLQPKNIAITSPDEIFLEKAMKFMERNIAEPSLNVEELGKEVGMSRITLYRKIKAITNQTAVEFIRSFRLKRAAQLLEENKLQVNEIAYMVGFQDVDYFRKCFKEQFGRTPSDHAKNKVPE